ncbi:unnamed protein product [marine sediment metagenome]|uniref:SpoVT-AbrB domain-containing protein n=1 Tax=marine sediment metagenome TaxID=412755 RepID=X1FT75_9ZZZZ
MKAGAERGRKQQGYDQPVRKLRKQDGSYMVTIPAGLVRELGFEEGDGIEFCKTEVSGVMWLVAIKRPGDSAGCRQGG